MNRELCGLQGDNTDGWKSYHGRTEDDLRMTIPGRVRSGRDDSTTMKR
jgi:hypothetical protein